MIASLLTALALASPAPAVPAACTIQASTVTVRLSVRRYPRVVDHVRDAKRPGKAPRRRRARAPCTLATHRSRRRYRAPPTRGQRPGAHPTLDRDEYPPAVSIEGGRGSSVRYVPDQENQGAGSSMGHQLRPYCDGQAFRLVSARP
jgi:hypothetical protein